MDQGNPHGCHRLLECRHTEGHRPWCHGEGCPRTASPPSSVHRNGPGITLGRLSLRAIAQKSRAGQWGRAGSWYVDLQEVVSLPRHQVRGITMPEIARSVLDDLALVLTIVVHTLTILTKRQKRPDDAS